MSITCARGHMESLPCTVCLELAAKDAALDAAFLAIEYVMVSTYSHECVDKVYHRLALTEKSFEGLKDAYAIIRKSREGSR